MEPESSATKDIVNASAAEKLEEHVVEVQKEDVKEPSKEVESVNIREDGSNSDTNQGQVDVGNQMQVTESEAREDKSENDGKNAHEGTNVDSKDKGERNEATDEILAEEKEQEPVFDGTEVPGLEANQSTPPHPSDPEAKSEVPAWPEKATALKNFVKEKGGVAVSTLLHRLSFQNDDGTQNSPVSDNEEASDCSRENDSIESPKTAEKSLWNPLSYIKMIRPGHGEEVKEEQLQPILVKGTIILYTRLGCHESMEARLFLHGKRLRYVEINIDLYPSRKQELEKLSGSSVVPKVFFNEVLIGSLYELKELEESGKLDEKIEYLKTEAPSKKAPLPPLSGEDDVSSRGPVDELALIVRKMKPRIVKDRFYKMRRFTKCFLGSEAVDFLSEDQYLEREEAVEVARKLASKLFFQPVLDENLFEDGNYLYRFLDDDPAVSSECCNIPRGIIDLKPKPITQIASQMRFLSSAILEAYTSPDGRHVDYRSIHGSEEFARYLRIIQELHRVEMKDMSREEKLAFFLNLYNMMAIHAILVWCHPTGPLERRKMFGDFKYVIGGCTYSLSAIQNGILRGNQRPPYNIMKPFGAKDKRSKFTLPYPEPLIHFALVCGTRSGPAIRCYSPGNIDKELVAAAQDFIRGGGLIVDFNAKVAYVSNIFRWFDVDFGRNEMEVLKHASNYLEPTHSEALLELLADTQLKVIYQPYDWGLNN